jgi:hypothetical protein
MAQQSKLDVSRWQASRRQFQYTPVLWFFYRMIEVAYLDGRSTARAEGPLRPGESPRLFPTDEALLARDWIARSEDAATREFISFPHCCRMLGLNAEVERAELLRRIDVEFMEPTGVDFTNDSDESWARLDELSAREPADDAEPLFNAPRIVPALDQLTLFAAVA